MSITQMLHDAVKKQFASFAQRKNCMKYTEKSWLLCMYIMQIHLLPELNTVFRFRLVYAVHAFPNQESTILYCERSSLCALLKNIV